ncbi:bifunctional 5,10-methylenetetrahydrofolate dehydrogenase/5,10-methenyltetrahydrofolate cyclohydrolase [Atopococcus tabaci]|uniref:bifunctional 5,10-methylenetetrahydrofolate dehydrogenase/5,10-methenyltetrahydrofolate cyclohydrolase n=1 Tax=Atopococcus tabaci TaxID=269774 RepID=UPI00042583A8|nr:bifunctional 5,10-methylenetetrahydrofolate dehydrogenase/5,10-methenyltetrahydrofolate cyclohydrolase [Atopococcus tabaci]
MMDLRGKDVAKRLRTEAAETIEKLKENNVAPALAIVRVGDDESSVSYEKSATSTMKKAGIDVKAFHYPESITEDEVVKNFQAINGDPAIHGILVMQPLPKHLSRETIASFISPQKDIDGLASANLGELVQESEKGFAPSTPTAVIEMLEHYEIDVKGKDVCIVGSSPVVGKPLGLMLVNRGATVTLCHIYTKDVKKYSQDADIVISATGAVGLITADHVKEGAVVIDVGFGYDEEGKPAGDVRFEEVTQKAGALTPVPGGVGTVTTAVLAKQVAKAAKGLSEKKGSR